MLSECISLDLISLGHLNFLQNKLFEFEIGDRNRNQSIIPKIVILLVGIMTVLIFTITITMVIIAKEQSSANLPLSF
jgi:uncharacterized membrane protein YuzA (DUF378 family)